MQDFVPFHTPSNTDSLPSSCIKTELTSIDSQPLPSSLSLITISNPNIPSLPPPARHSTIRAPITTPSRAKRAKLPYFIPRDSSGQRQRRHSSIYIEMSGQPYGNWSSPSAVKTEHDYAEDSRDTRRSSNILQQQQPYYLAQDDMFRRHGNRTDIRSPSTVPSLSSSSLTGAMGDTAISSHSSPSSDAASQHNRDWESEATSTSGLILPGGMAIQPNPMSYFPSPAASVSSVGSPGAYSIPYTHYIPASYSESSGFPSQPYPSDFHYSTPRISYGATRPNAASTSMTHGANSSTSASAGDGRANLRSPEDEICALRERIRRLDMEKEAASKRIRELQIAAGSSSTMLPSGLPVPFSTDSGMLATSDSWEARTKARVAYLCKVNRAGNALCAWHDSRRERRKHSARQAPYGTLNCGCTYEQALFEESLSRQNVGSYFPEGKVRMDPELRNPLLTLLERRYNYKDGDFEIDPDTSRWVGPDDGPEYWETRARTGVSKKKHDEKKSS